MKKAHAPGTKIMQLQAIPVFDPSPAAEDSCFFPLQSTTKEPNSDKKTQSPTKMSSVQKSKLNHNESRDSERGNPKYAMAMSESLWQLMNNSSNIQENFADKPYRHLVRLMKKTRKGYVESPSP